MILVKFRKWSEALDTTHQILETCSGLARQAFPDADSADAARDAALYIAHTEKGASIRALAAAAGTHPSTVLRAVRRVEARRDDPLFDGLLDAPAADAARPATAPDEESVRRAARSALRRLSEPGAFLLIAPGAEKGGIFCAANGHRKPIAMIPVAMAAEFTRRDWIAVTGQGSTTRRYRVTAPGRMALKRILAEDQARKAQSGFAEAQTPFTAQHGQAGVRHDIGGPLKVNLAESPLSWLSRRKGADGQPFLEAGEIEAGERLRADFEAAQMGPAVAQDWARLMAPARSTGGATPGDGAMRARDRVMDALGALGPGLGDVALRVCCFLEGLETCEKRMGWSARSGKVVLKIALQRLSDHYAAGRGA